MTSGKAATQLEKLAAPQKLSARLEQTKFRLETRFYITLLLFVGTYFISASIGSGWTLFLAAAFLCCCMLSLLIPSITLRSLFVEIIAPDEISAGDNVPIVVRINCKNWASPWLRWLILQVVPEPNDLYPGGESHEPILLESIRNGISIAMTGPCLKRGIRKLPPLTVETSFPMGLAWCKAVFQEQKQLAVFPRIEPMEGKFLYRLRSGVYVPGDAQSTNTGFQSCCSRGVRLYNRGDSRRFIHWSLSARHGQLMVRELEQEGLPAYDVVFDHNAEWQSAEQFELAVSATASLLQLGHSLGINPDLFVLKHALTREDELGERSSDIDQQQYLLASLAYKKEPFRKDGRRLSDPQAFENRTRAIVLVTPFIHSSKEQNANPRSRNSVFVLRVAHTATPPAAVESPTEFIVSKTEDFADL